MLDRASCKLPEELMRMLLEEIDSVPHLEALALLVEEPEQSWTVDRVADRLYLQCRDVEPVLDRLLQRGLIRKGSDPAYAFDAQGRNAARALSLVRAYRLNTVAMARLVHSKGPSGLAEFSRAFEFKQGS